MLNTARSYNSPEIEIYRDILHGIFPMDKLEFKLRTIVFRNKPIVEEIDYIEIYFNNIRYTSFELERLNGDLLELFEDKIWKDIKIKLENLKDKFLKS